MFNIAGMDELMNKLSGAKQNVVQWAANTVTTLGREVYSLSQDQVPVRTGALKASGTTSGPEMTPTSATYFVTYGGGLVSYAFLVHEDVTASHRNGKAHFLSDPLQEVEGSLTDLNTNFSTFVFGLSR